MKKNIENELPKIRVKLRDDKPLNAEGKYTLNYLVRFEGETIKKPTGLYIEEKNWNKKKETGVHFTNEEAAYLKQLILVAGNQHALKDAVLSKVLRASDINLAAGHLVHAKNGLTVERLAQAIANKEQVLLKRYHSIHSETITDRWVEPFGFTENYNTVMAFEVASKTNKTFHIDRITEVAFCDKPFAFEALHEQQIPDAFGFSARADGKKFPVDVSLSLKGYLLLKNEYPMTLPYIKHNAQQNTYALKMEVNDLAPVERFLKGLE